MQGEREYTRYQEYLAHQRAELAVDLGTAAVSIVTGGVINERPAEMSYEREHLADVISIETRRSVGASALSHEVFRPQSTATPLTEQTLLGQAA